MILTQPGDRARELIRGLRAATGLDLVTVKALVEGAPRPVKRAISREDAESLVRELQGAGGVLEIRPSA